MSGAHRAARRAASAQAGTVSSVNASPTYCHVTRSVERDIGTRWREPAGSPSRSGSVVPYAYHQPSLPRMTEGSANVSAKPALTGFVYVVLVDLSGASVDLPGALTAGPASARLVASARDAARG